VVSHGGFEGGKQVLLSTGLWAYNQAGLGESAEVRVWRNS
jgi:hypothetical protein